ncbi:MAG: FAD-dependent oxidoreductase [Armatimonadota bacterium]|nr:FAD-dependent oxidoreductase [Armatimonadota bacterium]
MNADDRFVIIGAGPAGISAAITAINRGFPPERITLVEKGQRHDPSRVSGFGGAGANSDGKLVLETEIGGELASYVSADIPQLLDQVLELYLGFLESPERETYQQMRGRFRDPTAEAQIQRASIRAGLEFIPADIIPLGTSTCHRIVDAWHDFLTERGARVLLETKVTHFAPGDGAWLLSCHDGQELRGRWLLVAPGRSGHDFLVRTLGENHLDTINGPIDVGVRVETDANLTQPLTDATYEFKLRGLIEGERVRTFCVCPQGSVLVERYDADLLAVNGQTRPESPTGRTNFAILHTISLNEPCHSPNQYAQLYIRTANILGAKNPIVQVWPNFAQRRRSRWSDLRKCFVDPTLERALPGDIRLALNAKSCRVLEAFMHALDSDGLLEGLCSNRTLMYAPEAKLYTVRPAELTEHLESERENLFFAGDGAGITRGLVQASASGMLVGREVARRAAQ